MNQEILNELYADLPTHVKPGGQGFKYVKTRDVLDRMNKAFKGRWSAEVTKMDRIDNDMVCEVLVTVYDDNRNKFHQTGFGSAALHQRTETGNTYKAAKSKAIKDAVKSWGVGLNLDGVEDEEPNSYSSAPPPSGPPSGPPNSPPMGPPSGTPPQNDAPPMSNPPSGGTPGGNLPPTGGTAPLTPPNGPPPVSEPPVGNTPTDDLPPMGATPPPTVAETAQVDNSTPADASNVQEFITPVQAIVLKARLDASGKGFEAFIKEMYQTVGLDPNTTPDSMDKVKYADGMKVIAYINKK